MAKIITEEIYNKLKDKQTKLGVTLDKCIQTGMLKPTLVVASSCVFIKNIMKLYSYMARNLW